MSALTIYGLKSCDTTRKARRWLTEHHCQHRFVDVRSDGVVEESVRDWIAQAGWEKLLNRRGTTWRQLSEVQRSGLDADKAVALIGEFPALIKRPVLTYNGTLLVGFNPDQYFELLG